MDMMVTVKKRSASAEAKAKKLAVNARLRECMSAHVPPLHSGAELRAACLAKGIKIPATSAAAWWRDDRHPSKITCLDKLGPGLGQGFSGIWIWDGIGDMRQGPAPAREPVPTTAPTPDIASKESESLYLMHAGLEEAFLEEGFPPDSAKALADTILLAATASPPVLPRGKTRDDSVRASVRQWFVAWRKNPELPKLQ